jgi:hypothetical protein
MLALLLAGCFSPTIHSGDLKCDPVGAACPPGLHCASDHRCYSAAEGPLTTAADMASRNAADLTLVTPDLTLVTPDLRPATPQQLQTGSVVVVSSSGSAQMTLAIGPSRAGSLLLVGLAISKPTSTTTVSAPPGWQMVVSAPNVAGQMRAELWMLPPAGNPGGIDSVTFSVTQSSNSHGFISEWIGVGGIDQVGTSVGTTSSSLNVATVAAPSQSKLGVGLFGEILPSVTNMPLGVTSGAGWTTFATDAANGTLMVHLVADFRILDAPPAAALAETETTDTTGNWASVIAAFK